MRPRRKVSLTEQMVRAAAAASNDGVGLKIICDAFGCGQSLLQSELRTIGHPGKYTGAVMGVPAAKIAARAHWPKLKAAMAEDGEQVARVAEPLPVRPRATYRPVSDELGIRVYTSPNGVSLPYLSSIYGEARA
ncbi:hypothetical protein [Pseudochelatococcus contaminans]|uniref:Uncharacterized protein n=1 Tax=Pseudochelatococcus contaminans TaxID=1538103 RepID=A0A7W5Z293_9HYPH|nr:hypothetical protein [Pseudochelatococcus contaminans]MBB3808780.1 hypothetical protein [Pseudochelatococcus contaminans]